MLMLSFSCPFVNAESQYQDSFFHSPKHPKFRQALHSCLEKNWLDH
ncbi:unknow [Vibrio campbellii]|nr:unknow [Vibrio campbellii]